MAVAKRPSLPNPTVPDNPTAAEAWTRQEVAAQLAALEAAMREATSQREFSQQSGVPRTTLQHWLSRKSSIEADPATVAFFESPAGVIFLHRLMVALLFVFTFVTSAGLRRILLFLELSGLSPFVATSFGTLQRQSSRMEEDIRSFAGEQREVLAGGMASKAITVCQDETFHPAPCLVAIEPVSDFLLLEAYAERRDQQTWDTHMQKALAGLKVQVVQSTSDEAKALLSHTKQMLGAHHSPDVFHVQHELSRASGVGLAAQTRAAESKLALASKAVEEQRQEADVWAQTQHGRGRPPDFACRIALTELRHREAEEAHRQASERRDAARAAVRAVGYAYHPVDMETGQRASAAQVEAQVQRHMKDVEKAVLEAKLPERCLKSIAKAKRVLVAMVATVTFFEKQVARRMDELALPAEVRSLLEETSIPAAYLSLAAKKAPTAEDRNRLTYKAQKLMAESQEAAEALALPEGEQSKLWKVALQCAQLFQRASSCVEGRNGQLSLRHHSLHRLSPSRLEALTAVHNYFITRPDGTTAAERFFGTTHADMFEHLIACSRPPPRPARRFATFSPPLLN